MPGFAGLFGGRGRTRTGTPVTQGQILSLLTTILASSCADTVFASGAQKPKRCMGNGLTSADNRCHRLPRTSHIDADTVRTRKPSMQLTDIAIKRLPAPPRGNKVTYDDAVKGFGIRVTAGDARAFVLNYRRKLDGRERRVTIGSFPDWSTGRRARGSQRLKREDRRWRRSCR